MVSSGTQTRLPVTGKLIKALDNRYRMGQADDATAARPHVRPVRVLLHLNASLAQHHGSTSQDLVSGILRQQGSAIPAYQVFPVFLSSITRRASVTVRSLQSCAHNPSRQGSLDA